MLFLAGRRSSKDGRLPFIHRLEGGLEKENESTQSKKKMFSLIHSGIDRNLIIIFKKKKKKVIKRNFFFLTFSVNRHVVWADSNLSSCLTLSTLHIFSFFGELILFWLEGRLICRLREPWPFLSSDNISCWPTL